MGVLFAEISGSYESPQVLRNLQVKQMGRMQVNVRSQDSPFDLGCRRTLHQPLERGGGIQDNHRASRSRRTASATEIGSFTGGSRRIRSRISSSVGVAATCCSSRRR